ncbi:MAG: NHL repeat-containing protein [Oscillospiraceae bacterium]|jgi:DNA-binding beta-propeller fold protein YncE|nr:NHL repeat-containing protein [Oscillospiraceae bacterium]
MIKKRLLPLLLAVLLTLLLGAETLAAVDIPYDSYIYNYRGYIEFTPAPYIPDGNVGGIELGVGSFNFPRGMCVGPDGRVYVADTGNNRVVVTNPAMTEAEMVITEFTNTDADGVRFQDTFNKPWGVTVSERGQLYIADSDNLRIVVLEEGELVKIIQNPQSEMLEPDFAFKPLEMGVDYADRVYVVAQGMFEGIMVFNAEGDFTGFYGTIPVQVSLWQQFWRLFSSQEQRARQQLFIPTEFTGVSVDKEGFIYASCIDPQGTQAAFRLNPKGEDVIKKGENGNLGGDTDPVPDTYNVYSGPSYIVDIVVRDKGVYSLLDRKRGRVFTYDNEGNMLYIFGGLGTQSGTFRLPSSIAYSGDKILVLDTDRQEIMAFKETEYGRLINEAVGLRYDGDEKEAVEKWRQVLTLNENLELANIGIGKAYLTEGNNEEAMRHLKLGMNRTYYSIAFKRYRNDILKENLGNILTAAAVLLVGLYVWRKIRRRGRRKGEVMGDE